ncbi:MAG: PrgI family protein [Candidatus Micrarchaeota archaeon]
MAYEIPANLQYKEKIMFNLTMGQLFWLGTFGIISAIIFLRLPFDLTIRFALALPFMACGIGFAFFGFYDKAKDRWTFHNSIKKAGYFDKKLEQFLEIKKIENDTIYLKDGSLRAILQIMPINFLMLAKTEQEAIIQAYKEFLNSLDFSIQIVMRTVNLDLNDYLKKLEAQSLETKNPRILEQFKAFDEFLQKHIADKKVKNRQFYLVIPYSQPAGTGKLLGIFGKKNETEKDAEMGLRQLDIRVKLCQQKLKKSNLLTMRLSELPAPEGAGVPSTARRWFS